MDKIKRWDWVNQMVRGDDGGRFVKYADHEQMVAELRAEADSLRKDAERWRYARTILAVEHIEDAYEMCGHPSHVPNEQESGRADQAIDAAMGAKA